MKILRHVMRKTAKNKPTHRHAQVARRSVTKTSSSDCSLQNQSDSLYFPARETFPSKSAKRSGTQFNLKKERKNMQISSAELVLPIQGVHRRLFLGARKLTYLEYEKANRRQGSALAGAWPTALTFDTNLPSAPCHLPFRS